MNRSCVLASLVLALTACGGGEAPGPDAGPACAEANRCQAACCATGEGCVGGACVPCGCGSRECGQDACGNPCGACALPRTCNAQQRCESPPPCQAGHTSCGGGCCDDATEVCGDGACEPRTTTACDPVAQTGCRPGQGCYYDWDADRNLCQPAGTGATGTPCTEDASCTPGGTCAIGDLCTPYCDPAAANTCLGGLTCLPYGDGTGFCAAECDVLAPTCAAPAACYPIYEATRGACASPGNSAPGESCELDTDCVAGGICLDEDGGVCSQLCRPEASPANCPSPLTCEQLGFGDAPAPGLGACMEASCDPVAQDCPDAPDGCFYDWDLQDYVCRAPGAKGDGQGCLEDWDCQRGLTCYGGPKHDRCTQYCDPAQATGGPCTGANVCEDAGDGYGFCTAP